MAKWKLSKWEILQKRMSALRGALKTPKAVDGISTTVLAIAPVLTAVDAVKASLAVDERKND
ncbi:hypothetical protein CMV30_03770 [Nibricoccus aquaticus]|uniref:Uncharacterized protein n=1 Tax=Nibricoccus aquaticus TaxID=2576891 RepID=A0A290Q3R3_9BACT|nr:hypothetical protein CMV30_03770 [Nibricoccus aquaticus]